MKNWLSDKTLPHIEDSRNVVREHQSPLDIVLPWGDNISLSDCNCQLDIDAGRNKAIAS